MGEHPGIPGEHGRNLHFEEELDKARADKQVNEGPEVSPFDAVRSQKLKAIATTLAELAAIINQMI